MFIATYIYTAKQLRITGFAPGPGSITLVMLGFKLLTF